MNAPHRAAAGATPARGPTALSRFRVHCRRWVRRWTVAWILLTGWLIRPVMAGELDDRIDPDDPMPPNVESPTFGGWQMWGDELVFHGWRIQRYVSSGHYRLLDESNLRHAWGTFEQCRAKLEEIKAAKHLAPMRGRVVLLVHGMLRTRSSMHKLAKALDDTGLYEAVPISYPSTREGIGYNARALASIIGGLGPEVTEIEIVGHSLGNLVIRHYYGDTLHPSDGPGPDPRIRRIVMLGPPNHPPQRARLWADHSTFRGLYYFALPGTGHQLAAGFSDLEPKLATPTCEFGILAGGKGDGKGWHPTLPGDDDTTVTVAETRLAGARDFAVLPVMHTFLMTDAKTIECTLRFLETGCFFGEALRQPIPALPAAVRDAE